jgi:ATP-binding cassette, subfamily B, bacterial PglK
MVILSSVKFKKLYLFLNCIKNLSQNKMKKIFLLLDNSQKKKFILIAFLILTVSIFEIAILSFVKPIIDFFTGSSDKIDNFIFNNISFLNSLSFELSLVIFFCVFLSRSFLSIILSYLRHKLTKSIHDNLSTKIYENYLLKDYSFFLNNNSSNLISNLILEIEKFSYKLMDSVTFFLVDLFIILTVTLYLLINYFESTLLLFFVTGTFASTFYFFYKKHFKFLGEIRILYDKKKVSTLQKSFYIIDFIKLSGLEKYFINSFKKETTISSHSNMKMSFISELPRNLLELIIVIIGSLILFFLYYYFSLSKQIVLSTLGLFIVAMFRILPSVNRILYALNNIKYYYPTTDIIYEEIKNIDLNNKKIISEVSSKIEFQDKIELKNISFEYLENKEKILHNLNFTIKKNQIIGILGKNGSGKSTFLNIFVGLLSPNEGGLFIDDKNVHQTKSQYQKLLGYVPQKTLLTDDTVRKNITFDFTDSKFDKKMYSDAVSKSELGEIIENLAEKDNTLLGERGTKLSGGQQQRVSIARAMYRDPEIIILDEATSALDEETEKKIIMNLVSKLKGKKTILIVSHNKDLFKFCDHVYELKDKKFDQINI